MIRVLNIISDTNIGGAGRVIINYLKYSDRRRFETAVALPRGSKLIGPLRELGAEIYEVDGIADKSLDIKAIGELKRLIRRVDPQIVHTHGSLSGRVAGRQCGRAVVFTRHCAFPVKDYIKKGPGRALNRFVNEHYADRIIAVSPAAAENLTDGGVSEKLIDVMMNGVERVDRVSNEEQAVLRRKLGIVPGDFVLGIVARIEDYKGHLDILEALKILRPEHPEVKLVIAGEGSFEDEVKRRVTELGLEDCVSLMGFVSEVAPVLSILDLQLNASYGTETSSLSILEGFSMGLPAVVSDYGGNPMLVDDGVNGLIFRRRDAGDLAEKISRLAADRTALARMGVEARRIYLERFTAEGFARRIEAVYIKTLEEKYGKKARH